MEVTYSPAFVRQLKKLEPALFEEVLEKVELFKNSKNHQQLKVHKLKGILKNRFSFSINYAYRIIFTYLDPLHRTGGQAKTTYLLAVGDHDVYK